MMPWLSAIGHWENNTVAIIKLFIGGTPNPLYPNPDGRNQYREPHAHRVAYEYATGEFTLGWPLHPVEQVYQRVELNDNPLAVGDTILLYAIPQEHLLTGVMARIDCPDARFAGASLKPTAMMYDRDTKEYTEDPVLDALFANLPLTDKYVDYKAVNLDTGGYFIPTGKTLVLGFKVAALPTDSTLRFSLMQASASLVAKVSGFDIPTAV